MKKHLLSLSAAVVALSMASQVSAQEFAVKTVTVGKASGAIVVDGKGTDAAWAAAPKRTINTIWTGQTVSMQASATSPAISFQALWDDANVYVLVNVADDDFYPGSESGQASWLSDKPELYFDCNAVKEDGVGPDTGNGTNGHRQFAPEFAEAQGTDFTFAYDATLASTGYSVEYSIPWATLKDADGTAISSESVIGFDVTVIDLDEAGKGGTTEAAQRINYSNDVDGTATPPRGESWDNLDWSATMSFVDGNATGISKKAANVNILKSNLVSNNLEFNQTVSNVKIMNTVGQVVKQDANVSDLNNGVYIVVATLENGQVVATRFVKN